MGKKTQVNKYIEALEEIKDKSPTIAELVDSLIAMMQDDYNDFIYKEIERQKLRKRESFVLVKQTPEYTKVESLAMMDFIVVPNEKKEDFRRAKNAVSSEFEDRRFTMRFVKNVGTILTRIQ